MSALDELILDFDIDKPHAMRTRHGMAENARSEFAQLRATVAEQARQLEEARRMIEFFKSLAVLDEMDAWLAANHAPAPQIA